MSLLSATRVRQSARRGRRLEPRRPVARTTPRDAVELADIAAPIGPSPVLAAPLVAAPAPVVPASLAGSVGVRSRVEVSGVAFDALTEQEAVDHVVDALDRGEGGLVVTPNVDILRQMRRPELRALAHDASLVLADGQPVVLASRWQGTPLPERVTGASLIVSLSTRALQEGRTVFFVGGSGDCTGPTAAVNLLREVAGVDTSKIISHCPPFGFERDPIEMHKLRTLLVRHQPDLVFVGLGFPKQDLLARQLRDLAPRSWFVGCGAAIAMLAGEVRRAPDWVQRCGGEWLFRCGQEPRRLFRRYFVDDAPFALGMLAGALRRRWSR